MVITHHRLLCIFDSSGYFGEIDEALDMLVGQIFVEDDLPEVCCLFVGLSEGIKERKRDFPFPDIVASGFANMGCVEIIENIIAYLKGISQ